MKKYLFYFKSNFKFWIIYLCPFILFPFIQSCSTTRFDNVQLEGSVDKTDIGYYYKSDLSLGSYIRSPSQDDIALNIAALYLLGLNGGNHQSNTFNYNIQNATPVFAMNSQSHGPFNDDIENPTLTLPSLSKGALSPNIKNNIRFITGLEYIQKGGKDPDITTHLYYLEVPFYVTYWTNPIAKGNIFGGLGPYIAYGIGGNTKTSTDKWKSFGNKGDFKPFDAGLTFTAGYKMTNSFSFRIAYDKGMVNTAKDAPNSKTHNNTLSLNIGYPLSKIFKK